MITPTNHHVVGDLLIAPKIVLPDGGGILDIMVSHERDEARDAYLKALQADVERTLGGHDGR